MKERLKLTPFNLIVLYAISIIIDVVSLIFSVPYIQYVIGPTSVMLSANLVVHNESGLVVFAWIYLILFTILLIVSFILAFFKKKELPFGIAITVDTLFHVVITIRALAVGGLNVYSTPELVGAIVSAAFVVFYFVLLKKGNGNEEK